MGDELSRVVDELTGAGLRPQVKVVIGGACTILELSRGMGCDAQSADAVPVVRTCEKGLAG